MLELLFILVAIFGKEETKKKVTKVAIAYYVFCVMCMIFIHGTKKTWDMLKRYMRAWLVYAKYLFHKR